MWRRYRGWHSDSNDGDAKDGESDAKDGSTGMVGDDNDSKEFSDEDIEDGSGLMISYQHRYLPRK